MVEGVGQGLNPLLQYWTMVIHPPMLYLGYVGFTVPFAFAMGSLITKQPGDAWIHTTRRWTIVTWLFQSAGILLGQGWAYAVLGWGGYWAWDPVENASLLPWITATAFLHSVMMQEKKGMMKVWNMVLISGTFFLCIFGTFLTRSGVVSSVHAFAQSPIGKYFVMFLAIGIAATVILILERSKYLKSEARLESVVSRESSFMFNNLILVASCFAVLWGTMFPVISEAVTGEKISVDAPFFNRINIPIGLALIFLTGIGPLIAWRRSSLESLKRAFLIPTIAGVVLMAVLAGFGVYEHPLRAGVVRIVHVRDGDHRHRVLERRFGHSRQERHRVHPGGHRADASQYAALRRLHGPHGHRVHVHRIHRARPSMWMSPRKWRRAVASSSAITMCTS